MLKVYVPFSGLKLAEHTKIVNRTSNCNVSLFKSALEIAVISSQPGGGNPTQAACQKTLRTAPRPLWNPPPRHRLGSLGNTILGPLDLVPYPPEPTPPHPQSNWETDFYPVLVVGGYALCLWLYEGAKPQPNNVSKLCAHGCISRLQFLEEGKRPPPPRQDSASGLY